MLELLIIIFLELLYIRLIPSATLPNYDKDFIGLSFVDIDKPYKYLFFIKKYQTKNQIDVYCYSTLNLAIRPRRLFELYCFSISDVIDYSNLKQIVHFYLLQKKTIFVNLIFHTIDINGTIIIFSVNGIFTETYEPYNDLKNQIICGMEEYWAKDLSKYEIHVKSLY